MRLVAHALGLFVIAVPAVAASADPQALVLRQADLPRGFVADAHEGGVTPNAIYTSPPGLPKVVVKSGRVTGFRRVFRHRTSKTKAINAGVDLFRAPKGAHLFLAWADGYQRKANVSRNPINAYGREAAGIGARSWVYWSGYPGYYVLVSWAYGRAYGYLVSWDIGREETLELARVQQRRMAGALR